MEKILTDADYLASRFPVFRGAPDPFTIANFPNFPKLFAIPIVCPIVHPWFGIIFRENQNCCVSATHIPFDYVHQNHIFRGKAHPGSRGLDRHERSRRTIAPPPGPR